MKIKAINLKIFQSSWGEIIEEFFVEELTRSSVGDRHGIQNLPDQDQLVCLTALCSCILQPIRNVHGRVNINSGLRVIELNRIITGSDKDTSQHIRGRHQTSSALVFRISTLPNGSRKIWNWTRVFWSATPGVIPLQDGFMSHIVQMAKTGTDG